jgi:hypothetical protein
MIEIRAVSQFIENRSLTIVLNYTFEKTKKQKTKTDIIRK